MSRYELKLGPWISARESYQSAEAFAALYERTQLIVFRYIYALHGEPQEDVEDLWMETFLKAWQSRRRFTGDADAALGWLLRIARNLVIDRQRQQQRRPLSHLQDLETLSAAAKDAPEERVLAKEAQQAVMTLLEGLPQQQREIIILRYIVGWRVKEIAQHLGVAENTVSVTLRRGLAKLSQSQE